MKAGQRISNQTLTLHFVSGTGRFAFITPKSLGNAVKRNLVRRRGRAILSSHLETLSKLDGVLRFHPAASTQTFDEISNSIGDLVKRAGS
jgi:ribonuclease P protein component